MKINALKALVKHGKLEPFIQHIRFPQYKNLEPFTKIDFTFPITALVGANGTNKSSLLKALYGCAGNNNLGNYWFSTETDPINEGDDFPNCFIYGYLNDHTQQTVEVLKTRVKKENDPDYWEPSRPILQYGMARMPPRDSKDKNRSLTRWKGIQKNVLLIDFRHALSAFDRYFYYGDFARLTTFQEKKSFIRYKAAHLKSAIDSGAKSYTHYKVEKIINKDNTTLSQEELKAVCAILGRNYSEIKLISHRFFKVEGYTARIINASHQYTEAFAGSGEFAVITMVTQIVRCEPNSLILIDEPEVSLHPGAQERLLEFLAQQSLEKKHQIIFTTHSPALIRDLPPEAIKVLTLDNKTQRVILTSQSSLPDEAFMQIGEPVSGVKTIITEDKLAIEIIKKSLRANSPSKLKLLKFNYFPGGASVLFNHYITAYASEDRNDVLCMLDGDQRPQISWPNKKESGIISDEDLGGIIKSLTGIEIKFNTDSGTSTIKDSQKIKAQRAFLSWCFTNVKYLPSNFCPEAFVLSKLGHSDLTDPKNAFLEITRESLGLADSEDDPNSETIFQEQCRRVAEIPNDDSDLKSIALLIDDFLREI
ncbi:AAA family ATPase [Comamonas sediminis]|uniref:AAA family ATPase n=1 Tax=Comamonas sediminis TaxID=1783360 RepID=A0ABV4B0G9_9BURK